MEKNNTQERLDQMLEEMREITGRDVIVYSADGEWIAGVPEDPHSALRRVLTGVIPAERAAETFRRLCVPFGSSLLFVVLHKQGAGGILSEMLTHLFVSGPGDAVIEMDESRTVLLKDFGEMEDISPARFAETIVDNLEAEAMTSVWVGYGEAVASPDQLATAYQNACTALKIGVVFYADEKAYSYQRLGIARLIYQLPEDLCEMFLREVLGENRELDLDEETMHTIRTLFENNLNISETARQLYIHRNTLVYRLERIEKRLGLDIRTFEDAMLFRIAMMVRMHLDDTRNPIFATVVK